MDTDHEYHAMLIHVDSILIENCALYFQDQYRVDDWEHCIDIFDKDGPWLQLWAETDKDCYLRPVAENYLVRLDTPNSTSINGTISRILGRLVHATVT